MGSNWFVAGFLFWWYDCKGAYVAGCSVSGHHIWILIWIFQKILTLFLSIWTSFFLVAFLYGEFMNLIGQTDWQFPLILADLEPEAGRVRPWLQGTPEGGLGHPSRCHHHHHHHHLPLSRRIIKSLLFNFFRRSTPSDGALRAPAHATPISWCWQGSAPASVLLYFTIFPWALISAVILGRWGQSPVWPPSSIFCYYGDGNYYGNWFFFRLSIFFKMGFIFFSQYLSEGGKKISLRLRIHLCCKNLSFSLPFLAVPPLTPPWSCGMWMLVGSYIASMATGAARRTLFLLLLSMIRKYAHIYRYRYRYVCI